MRHWLRNHDSRGRASRRGGHLWIGLAAIVVTITVLVLPIAANATPQAPAPQPVPAVVKPGQPATPETQEYAGTSTCLDCHGKYDRKMTETPHRSLFSKGTQGGKVKGCESCHGPSMAHAQSNGKTRPAVSFRTKTREEIRAVNRACLDCHREEKLATFENKGHGRGGKNSCLACHSMHKAKEKQLLSKADPAACYTCHPGTRAQMNMPSHHPIREGKMKCSGCHNPHGSPSGNRAMLQRETLNETCLKCHSNLAGPWTFEHVPVAKDCAICHRAHGSVQPQLLVQPLTALCVRCHNPQHAGFAFRTNRQRSLQRQVAYQWCFNCHSQIHGSDNDHGFNN